jgi:hypothetical protein
MIDDISEEQVAKYLAANTDFFEHNKDLLIDLKIPHESGRAVSLVEKQVSGMRERNTDLRRRLSQLIANARENDRLFEQTRRLVLAFLDCQNLQQICQALNQSFELHFKVQYTSLVLFDAPVGCDARICTINEAHHYLGKYLKSRQTIGGGLDLKERKFLFGDKAEEIGSAALAVLSHGNLYGVLAIGNKDPSYYSSSVGTIFLSYIAEVLSRSLHSVSKY